MPKARSPAPGYVERMLDALAGAGGVGALQPGGVTICEVQHEPDCALLRGGECRCEFKLVFREIDLNDFQRGEDDDGSVDA